MTIQTLELLILTSFTVTGILCALWVRNTAKIEEEIKQREYERAIKRNAKMAEFLK